MPRKQKKSSEGQVMIRKGKKYPGIQTEETESFETETIKVPEKFVVGSGPTAEVWRMFGIKKQVAAYEPVWAEVGLSLPTKVDKLEEADEWAREFILDRIQKELTELSEE